MKSHAWSRWTYHLDYLAKAEGYMDSRVASICRAHTPFLLCALSRAAGQRKHPTALPGTLQSHSGHSKPWSKLHLPQAARCQVTSVTGTEHLYCNFTTWRRQMGNCSCAYLLTLVTENNAWCGTATLNTFLRLQWSEDIATYFFSLFALLPHGMAKPPLSSRSSFPFSSITAPPVSSFVSRQPLIILEWLSRGKFSEKHPRNCVRYKVSVTVNGS